LSAPDTRGEAAGEHESAFLDASESGNDVFLLTAAKLPAVSGVSGDTDTNFDVYDARVCAQAPSFSCLPGSEPGQAACDETQRACKPPATPPTSFTAPASPSVSGPGNVSAVEVRGSKEQSGKTKQLTRAQLLKRALSVCSKKYKRDKKKRASCEARARKWYAPKRATKASPKTRSGVSR
jgi:hypothetical protein